MRYSVFFAFVLSVLPGAAVEAGAFDGKAVSEQYYLVRGACRIGEDPATGRELTPAEMRDQCAVLHDLGQQLTDHGYCWDKSELVWYACEQQGS